jgi:hypothetical protein
VQDAAIPVPVVEPQPIVMAPEGVHDVIDDNVPLEEFPLEENDDVENAPLEEKQPTGDDEPVTRTGRHIHKNRKFFGDQWANYQYGKDPKQKIRAGCLNDQFLSKLTWDRSITSLKSRDARAMMAVLEQHTDDNYNTVEWMHPLALATLANAEDNPTWEQAMNGPDKAGYWKACEIELNTLTQKRDAWDVVDREPWMNVLPSTWAFKCKRYPDGSV